MRESLSAARVMIGFAWRADTRGAVSMLCLRVLGAVATTAFAWFMKLIVDGVVARDLPQVVKGAVFVAACLASAQLAGNVAFRLRIRLEERMSLLVDEELIGLAAGVPGIEHHERPEYLKELELLSGARISLSQTAGSVFEIVAVVVRTMGTAALLAGLHPLLLLLPLFAVPSVIAGRRATLMRERAAETTAPEVRLGTALFELATTAGPAKELRLFRLGEELISRHRAAWDIHYDGLFRAQFRGALTTTVGWLIFTGGYTAAIVFVALRAVSGQLSIGDVYLAMSLAGQVNGQVAQFVSTYSWSVQTMKSAKRYVWLRDYATAAVAALGCVGDGWLPAPDRLVGGIELDRVSFRYPDTEVDVLGEVSMRLPAGSTVALVGENGAGKTTLIKLLCRFYEPTGGAILVDGVDLRRIEVEDWRSHLAAGFQDFARFELIAREAVGVGSLPAIGDDDAILSALGRAGAPDVADQLERSLDTQLGKSFEGGSELSMGQWQKLALGRAMMRLRPLLLILDEPTASLDAPTEHALFERYAGTAKEIAAETGSVTVLVSHRFSTVRMADLIVVLEGGGVTEVGTHTELMRRDGTYAELYNLQARAYR
jgi:ATP-binding cassette subfamily B protein